MKKRNIISLLITVIYMLTLIPTAYAGDVLTVTSPANGSIVSFETNVFEVTPPGSKTIEKTNFILDGEFIGNGDAEGKLTREEELTLGKHKLEVIAVYDDGTAEKASSEFTSAIIPQSATVDFENSVLGTYTAADAATTAAKSLRGLSSNIFTEGEVSIGSDGSYGNVFKILGVKNRVAAANACFTTYANPTFNNDGTVQSYSAVTGGKHILNFDMYIPYIDGSFALQIRPYTSGGVSFDSGVTLISARLPIGYTNANRIENTDCGWFNINFVSDLDTGKYTAEIKAKTSNKTWTIAETPYTKPQDAGINYYQIGAYVYKNYYVAYDNIKTEMIGNTLGITDVLFKDETNPSCDSDGYVNTDSHSVKRDVTQMLVRFDRSLNSATVTKDNFIVVAGGNRVGISDVNYDETTRSAVLTLNNSFITTNGKSYVQMSENVKLKGNTETIGVASWKAFNLASYGFEIQSVEYLKGVSDVYSASQLSVGNNLTAKIKISNVSDTDKKLTAVLVVKDGKRILSVKPLTATIDAGNSNFTASITSESITSAENLSAFLIFINSLSNPVYIDSFDLN